MLRAWLVVVLALAPIAAAEGPAAELGIENPDGFFPVTLYAHLMGWQDFPINTQEPQETWAEAEPRGLLTHTVSCVPDGLPIHVNEEYHTLYGYSSPSYVEYDFLEGGKPRTHPERGLAGDVNIEPGTRQTMYWYLATQTGLPGTDPADVNSVPVVVPGVVVRATMRAGDAISVDDMSYNTGPIIAQGETEPATLAAGATSGGATYVGQVNGLHIYEFEVSMDLEQARIPRETGFSLRVDVFMPNDAGVCSDPCGEGYFMANLVRNHTDPDHRPRIEMSVADPVRIEGVRPRLYDSAVLIDVEATSPWGAYDVDESNLTATISGPDGVTALQTTHVAQHIAEYYHQEPMMVTYKFDRADLAAGFYTFRLEIQNDQHTATASATAAFSLDPDRVYPVSADGPAPALPPEQAMPGLSMVFLLLAVAAGAAFQRLPPNKS